MRFYQLAALVLSAIVAGCGGRDSVEYAVLDDSVELLRARFNADSGKVRAIFLAAPT